MSWYGRDLLWPAATRKRPLNLHKLKTMRVYWTVEGGVSLEAADMTLRGLAPVLNGKQLDAPAEAIDQGDGGLELRYSGLPGGAAFRVEFHPEPDGKWWLRYRVEGLEPAFVLDSFGLHFQAVENLRAYLLNGYHSWDGSQYVEPEAMADWGADEPRPEQSYAMTQLLPRAGSRSLVVGFERHDRFQHTLTWDTSRTPPALMILTLWDQKDRSGLAACESERVLLLDGNRIEEGLHDLARRVSRALPMTPRAVDRITGWCSWYNLYAAITEENILELLSHTAEVVRREGLPMQVFQVDDGFTPEMGDWLHVKPQFPRGMRPLLDDIRAQGFIPGLWIAPFIVGNRSRLYRDHPDWVIGDRLMGGPLVQMKLYGEFRWHKRSEEYYILDTTHPEALDYLRRVFRTWRRDWGCEYFKTDFMFYGAEYGPDRASRHRPGMTRIEIWRQVAGMIREEIGEALWLGCGCPLWASAGLVDAVRIGGDVGVEWRGNNSAQSLLGDLATRSFGNGILWQVDPDCILLRERFHYLTDAEVRSLALYAGMAGGVMMTSDDLAALSPDRLRLWKLVLQAGPAPGRFPLLGQSRICYKRGPTGHEPAADPVLVQVRSGWLDGRNPAFAVLAFNTGDHPVQRTLPLEALGLPGPLYALEWRAQRAGPEPVDQLSVTLASHDCILVFLTAVPLKAIPDSLP